MPCIDAQEVPFQADARPEISPDFSLLLLAVIPTLGSDENHGVSLLNVWGEEWDDAPDPFPMDSLRIDVLHAAQGNASEVARSLLENILSQIRVATRQWWIGHSVHPLVGYLRNTFEIAQAGQPRGQPSGLGQGRTVTGDEKPVTRSCWRTAVMEASREAQVPLHQELFLDGRYYMASHDYRRAVVDLATACEHAKEQTFERVYTEMSYGAEYRRGRILAGYDLPMHLSETLELRFGRSYARENSEKFEVLQDLWDARGNVAHGRAPFFRRAGSVCQVTEEECKRFAAAVDHCIGWLAALTGSAANDA